MHDEYFIGDDWTHHIQWSKRTKLDVILLGSKGRGIENKYVHKERVFVKKKIDDNTNNSQIEIHLEYLSRSSRLLVLLSWFSFQGTSLPASFLLSKASAAFLELR